MSRTKLTVKDYLQSKGKRQLSVMFVHSAEEASAAEEANIDMICTSHDAPQFGVYNSFDELKRIREAAPTCFMQSGGAVRVASEYEAMKLSHKYLDIGADVIYGGNWSYKWLRALRDEYIPINSHVGLVPGNATWIGGFKAQGKTADEAIKVLQHTLELQDAGVVGVEFEVVPPKVAEIVTKKVDIITLSMGSGSGCDGQYLFANDVLGYTDGHTPRHARIYRDFKTEYAKLQVERVNAFKEFHADTINKKFNDPKITVGIEDKEYEKFLKLSEKF
ncbi:MAG: 3-methyl-2-oxobutanoate hydroxymethyltransferase [Pelagibacteraceae bacterium]|jgi:3-methyl-2-oxobutanoate hydroxymethyltransferase|nr:3-methyl-2-oxobutanoate hydroxymethyltransferase [Pelagibacteraceae bacterium]MBT3901616.1 3-methyl-2-oxobutanoate hydroxymethyltransferase [Pelagibacteraceae bacterium]MBT4645816.1 3-methyl-2-oxobutanoate hydroxymethyltransferase [Pelagibacteraceae bacterium]MBT4951728.1 3-methyl-2-oxobutanoate hydroxymethyltransferase [Pelagibacteraceae bacterium]MBT5214179.1 3-methyl-2-oxobutanoate hydroxymethyltransferase [Pelagibacteraceae bacterium]